MTIAPLGPPSSSSASPPVAAVSAPSGVSSAPTTLSPPRERELGVFETGIRWLFRTLAEGIAKIVAVVKEWFAPRNLPPPVRGLPEEPPPAPPSPPPEPENEVLTYLAALQRGEAPPDLFQRFNEGATLEEKDRVYTRLGALYVTTTFFGAYLDAFNPDRIRRRAIEIGRERARENPALLVNDMRRILEEMLEVSTSS